MGDAPECVTIQVLRCSACNKKFHVVLSERLLIINCSHCGFPYKRDVNSGWQADLERWKAMGHRLRLNNGDTHGRNEG